RPGKRSGKSAAPQCRRKCPEEPAALASRRRCPILFGHSAQRAEAGRGIVRKFSCCLDVAIFFLHSGRKIVDLEQHFSPGALCGKAMSIRSSVVTASSSRLQPPHRTILSLIGQTPVVELSSFDTGLCRLFVKLESQ